MMSEDSKEEKLMRSAPPIVLVCSIAVLAAAGFALQPAKPAAGAMYSRVPMAAKDAHARSSAMSMSVAQAIELAEKETGGRVTSIKARLTGTPAYEVIVVTNEAEEHLIIDPEDQAVIERLPYTLPGEAPAGEVVEMPSGLLYYDLREGEGAMPSGSTAVVKVHYTGWFVDGTKFDSSLDRGQPAQFQLDIVIPGWTTGVGSMKVGGKRKLIIPADLGYGPGRADRQGNVVIPSFATLIFDVELLEIVSDGQ